MFFALCPWHIRTTFTYRMDMGGWPYNPGWNRLVTVNNGQGGQLQVTYGKSFGGSTLNEEANYHRVAELLRRIPAARPIAVVL